MSNRIEWTEDKLQYIREHYPTETAQDIADVIGCSDSTVRMKAMELGLKKASSYKRTDFIGRYTGKRKYKR